MEHRLKEQIAANTEYLNDCVAILQSARQELEVAPHNRMLQIRVAMLEASVQIMIENIDMLRVQLKSFTLQ